MLGVEKIMGYYMRYIIDDEKGISLDAIEYGLKSVDIKYNIKKLRWGRGNGELFYGDDLYGEIEISRIDPEDDEIEELIKDVENAVTGDKDKVLSFLKNTKSMFVIHVLWQGRDAEATLDIIAPLWDWLFENYNGLLHADGEGYYDVHNQILQTE